MEGSKDNASAVRQALKGLWDKQADMNDVQRIAANSFALGLQMGNRARKGEQHERTGTGEGTR